MTRSRELKDWIPLWLRILDALSVPGCEWVDNPTLVDSLGMRPDSLRHALERLERDGLTRHMMLQVRLPVRKGRGRSLEVRTVRCNALTEAGAEALAGARLAMRRFGGGA